LEEIEDKGFFLIKNALDYLPLKHTIFSFSPKIGCSLAPKAYIQKILGRMGLLF